MSKFFNWKQQNDIEYQTGACIDDIEDAQEITDLCKYESTSKITVRRAFLKDYLYDKEISYLATAEHIPDIDSFDFEEFLISMQFGLDESSFNDDGILPSEGGYFTSDYEESDVGSYSPPLTQTKKILLEKLLKHNSDYDKRNEVLEEYQENRLKKRAMRAYARLRRVKEMNLKNAEEEARILEKMELNDKKLNKSFYYEPTEPNTYKILLNKRRKAIHRKYELYANDRHFRRYYYQKILENVSTAVNLTELTKFESTDDDEENDAQCYYVPSLITSIPCSPKINSESTFADIDTLSAIQPSRRTQPFSCSTPIKYTSSLIEMKYPSPTQCLSPIRSPTIKSPTRLVSKSPMLSPSVIQIPEYSPELLSYQPESSQVISFESGQSTPPTPKSPEVQEHSQIYDEDDLDWRGAYFVPKSSDEACTESSFYDDAVPASELEFFTSEWEFNEATRPEVKSRTVSKFNKLMEETLHDEYDHDDEKAEKNKRKFEITLQFRNFIDAQRARKAYKRLKTVMDRKIGDPMEAADIMMEMEMKDKKLNRPFYYEENESEIFKRLLEKRRRAIVNKYDLYGISEEYREDLKNRILDAYRNIDPAPLFEKKKDEDEDLSSFNDTEVATSEEEFMSDVEIIMPGTFKKPLTRRKKKLIERLMHYLPDQRTDTEEVTLDKQRERFELIQKFKAELRDQQIEKARKRLEKIDRAAITNIEKRAKILMEGEIHDKKLDRGFYYKAIEPVQVREILHKRLRAIRRKYQRYKTDPEYRQEIEEKIRRGVPYQEKSFDEEFFEQSIPFPDANIPDLREDQRDFHDVEHCSLTSIRVRDLLGRKVERKREYAEAAVWPPRRMSAPDEFDSIHMDAMSMGNRCGSQTDLSYASGLLHADRPYMCRHDDELFCNEIHEDYYCKGYSDTSYDY